MKLKLVSFLHLGAEPRVLQRFTLLGSWSGRCALCGERGPSKVPVFACSTPDSGMYQAMPCKDAEHLKELLFSIESLAPRISTFSGPPPNLIYRGLWVHFNERFDYPVLIFHDGLSPKTRESIVAKTPGQRIWPGARACSNLPCIPEQSSSSGSSPWGTGSPVRRSTRSTATSEQEPGRRAQGGPQRFLGFREFGSEGSAAGCRRHVGVDQKYQSAQQRAEPSPGYMAQSRFRSGRAVGEVGFRLVLPRLLVLAATALMCPS